MATPAMPREPGFNPYAAPQNDGKALTRYYKIVSTRLTYAECWRISPNPLTFAFMAVSKTLRIQVPFRSAARYPDKLTLVDLDKIPPHVLENWRPMLDASPPLGQRMKLCFLMPTTGRNSESFLAILVRDDQRWNVVLSYDRMQTNLVVRTVVSTSITSRLSNGQRAVTRDSRSYIASAADTIVQVVGRQPLSGLVDRHHNWLAENGWTAVPVPEGELERISLMRMQAAFDQLIDRGVYVPVSEREFEALSQLRQQAIASHSHAGRALRIIELSFWFAIPIACTMAWTPDARRFVLNAVIPGCFMGAVLVRLIRYFVEWTNRRGRGL